MKKFYKAPEFDILTVAKEDVLTGSGETYIDKNDNVVGDDFLPM